MTDDSPRYLYPEQIVSTEWVAGHLDDLSLRIFDCTTYLIYEMGTGRPYRVESGRADFDAGHIPGSAFIDLQEELSDKDAKTNFMMLPVKSWRAASPRRASGGHARRPLIRKAIQWATRNGGCCVGRFRQRGDPGRRLRQVGGGGPSRSTMPHVYPAAQLTPARPEFSSARRR